MVECYCCNQGRDESEFGYRRNGSLRMACRPCCVGFKALHPAVVSDVRPRLLAILGFSSLREYMRSGVGRSAWRRACAMRGKRCPLCGGRAVRMHFTRCTAADLRGETADHVFLLCRGCYDFVVAGEWIERPDDGPSRRGISDAPAAEPSPCDQRKTRRQRREEVDAANETRRRAAGTTEPLPEHPVGAGAWAAIAARKEAGRRTKGGQEIRRRAKAGRVIVLGTGRKERKESKPPSAGKPVDCRQFASESQRSLVESRIAARREARGQSR